MSDNESKACWARTYWRDSLDEATLINGQMVYPSWIRAVVAAMHQVDVMGKPTKFTIRSEFDEIEALDTILVSWQEYVPTRENILDGHGTVLMTIYDEEQKNNE